VKLTGGQRIAVSLAGLALAVTGVAVLRTRPHDRSACAARTKYDTYLDERGHSRKDD
jgi:hypothetical protein